VEQFTDQMNQNACLNPSNSEAPLVHNTDNIPLRVPWLLTKGLILHGQQYYNGVRVSVRGCIAA
jgi:hypothetical protein